jgi:hypothetical protein
MSALFRLALSPEGVHRVEVIPIQALPGHTVPAEPAEAGRILDEMRSLCTPLGTSLRIRKDRAGRPLGVVDVPEPEVTPRPPVREGLSFAKFPRTREIPPGRAGGAIRKEVPKDAVKLEPPVELAPAVELLGFRLPPAAREGGILNITTWWRVTRPVREYRLLAFELVTDGGVLRRGTPWYTRHDPGDWSLPLARMEPGEIVEDFYPARLAGLPAGNCEVRALVLDPARPGAKRPLGRGQILGTVRIRPDQ